MARSGVALLGCAALLVAVLSLPAAHGFNAQGSLRYGYAKLFSIIPQEGPSASPNCKSIECPPYALVHEETDFQIRRYRQSVWAETDPINEVSFKKAVYSGFHRLFQYIQGRNEDEVTIPMTAPVLTTVKPSGGPFCASTFLVRFLVPKKFSSAPPQPSSALDLHIRRTPSLCVAVRKFSGFATDFNVAQEAANLASSLESTRWANISSAASGEAYSIAEYNSPFELIGRVNEIWVPFKEASGPEDECDP
eukprot:TRINITY_DN11578_c0_g1_i1.p1 TRINITY_DN11578_c0_g1~~TRINITY_DN11578_c0_g1_i1.p1  ORF type:complete len:250 (+),score=-3.31 TRINITY_DN11578_c0_g1_i1:192-941(+)